MTAKEEAEELIGRFMAIDTHDEDSFIVRKQRAKQCALIAVEFAANQFDKYCCAEIGLHWTKDNERTDGSWDHFRYIKEEIECID
jgi:hypothetical protein